jgi:hypothetical protein
LAAILREIGTVAALSRASLRNIKNRSADKNWQAVSR